METLSISLFQREEQQQHHLLDEKKYKPGVMSVIVLK
jgi:hypothetical protein